MTETASAPVKPDNLGAPCLCTTIEQDETCPVGSPSLLCEICDGKGVVPYVKLDGPELWKIVFGIANEVAHEITDEQYGKIAEAINSVFINTMPSAVCELHGPFGYIVGRFDLREDEWSLENDPVGEAEAAKGFFSIPLYALTDPFTEIGIASSKNVASPAARELALEEVKLERSIERWRNMKPLEVMKGSTAQITYALEDARKDILSLASALSSLDHADAGKVEGDGIERKFQLGDRVTKNKGSSWTGRVVGFYSTELTPTGYAVESETEIGSVQIYPEAALCLVPSAPASEGAE